MKNSYAFLIPALMALSCGTDHSGQSVVCFSIRYPFEQCDPTNEDEKPSDAGQSGSDVAKPVPMSAYEGDSECVVGREKVLL